MRTTRTRRRECSDLTRVMNIVVNTKSSYNITATGATIMPIQCSLDPLGNQQCLSLSQNVTGNITSRTLLPQFSYDPTPATSSCVIDSIYSPHYKIDAIWLEDHQNSYANVTAPSLEDPRITSLLFYYNIYPYHTGETENGESLRIESYVNVTQAGDSQVWKNASMYAGEKNTLTVRHKYDFVARRLTLFHDWLCSEKDSSSP